jgi:hypothetical protein
MKLGKKLGELTQSLCFRVDFVARTLSEECLARVGVVGVSLMALLCEFLLAFYSLYPMASWFLTFFMKAGFGSVSTPWQNFTAKPRPVTENDILRAQAGLNATVEMLNSKRIKLRHLETKMQEKRVRDFVWLSSIARFLTLRIRRRRTESWQKCCHRFVEMVILKVGRFI